LAIFHQKQEVRQHDKILYKSTLTLINVMNFNFLTNFTTAAGVNFQYFTFHDQQRGVTQNKDEERRGRRSRKRRKFT